MRWIARVLVLVVLTILPHQALAESHQPAPRVPYSSSCGVRLNEDDAGPVRGVHCATGVAVRVAGSGMKLQPFHGTSFQVRFTEATEFTTDSGEGVLDGLAVSDYVCVAYLTHARRAIALLVLFDPKAVPCRVHT